jgi:hypothetical protein
MPVEYQSSPLFQGRSLSGGKAGPVKRRLWEKESPSEYYQSLLKSSPNHHLKTSSMFLQALKELHSGFRRIGVTETNSMRSDLPPSASN